MYSFASLEKAIADIAARLRAEYTGIRTGEATPALLDSVRVDAYGSAMPITQVGSVSIEDPKTLRVVPWDTGLVRAIEKAIGDADLGVSVSVDEKGLRVHFPPLTHERRQQLAKIVGEKLEGARISLRNERDAVWNDIQAQEKSGMLSEDQKFRAKEDMEKRVREGNALLQDIASRKEREIMG